MFFLFQGNGWSGLQDSHWSAPGFRLHLRRFDIPRIYYPPETVESTSIITKTQGQLTTVGFYKIELSTLFLVLV